MDRIDDLLGRLTLEEQVGMLFMEAQMLIPQAEWAETPVYIKATAGMRLVTEEELLEPA